MLILFVVNRKPRNSRVVRKRLTGEKKSSDCDKIKNDLPVEKTIGGFIYEKRSHRQR